MPDDAPRSDSSSANAGTFTLDGILFDLDGTLLDSALDFDAMRREMGLPPGHPILEALVSLSDEERQRCEEILHRHELAGAERASLLPGVLDFLEHVKQLGLRRAIVTRNSRVVTQAMLAKLPIEFDPVITRDDGPVKPDPWAVQAVCRAWQTSPDRVVFIGDYWFDIACGKSAGTRTVLYSAGDRSVKRLERAGFPPDAGADFVLACFTEAALLWQFLGVKTV